jgi:hypothetical protein
LPSAWLSVSIFFRSSKSISTAILNAKFKRKLN